ncbi:gem-associated protein 6-like [Amphiura filiformis]|uniref:gem-associated protein 6-like n=1 Tax=Amphiura filiformis TaxID=82378 RepID=UPI003B218249
MAAYTDENVAISGDVFRLFSPTDWRKYVYKEVLVESADKKQHKGWVQTIDPVSKSIVLVGSQCKENIPVQVVVGHAIKSITILSEVEEHLLEDHRLWLDRLFTKSTLQPEYSSQDLLNRKLELKSWLERNRVPVQVSGDEGELLSISDALFIQPPYEAENCISTNEIILGRVQALINSKPGNTDQT